MRIGSDDPDLIRIAAREQRPLSVHDMDTGCEGWPAQYQQALIVEAPHVRAIAGRLIAANEDVVGRPAGLWKRHELVCGRDFTCLLRKVDEVGRAGGGVGIITVAEAGIADEERGACP